MIDGEPISNSNSTQEVYKTEETQIGIWIDGSPLYRRIIKGNFTITWNEQIRLVEMPDVKDVIKIEGITGDHTVNRSQSPISHGSTTSSGSSSVHWSYTGGYLCAYYTTTTDSVAGKTYDEVLTAIIEYTKTTD